MNFKKFERLNAQGLPWAVVTVEQLSEDSYALKYNKPEDLVPGDIWKELLSQAKNAAIKFGARTIVLRLRLEYHASLFRSLLTELGFQKIAGRVEYKAQIKSLPTSGSSPLSWKSVKELGWSSSDIAHFTQSIFVNDPSVNANENPEDFIQDWLIHDELTSGTECISIGFFNGNAIALVVAQINPEIGWSRISYMGILPEYRKMKLGQWVHRRGFQMMKDQGGILYHGGTHVENRAMRRLFEGHGCHLLCEMEEWTFYWTLKI